MNPVSNPISNLLLLRSGSASGPPPITEPTVQATNILFSNIMDTTITISWTIGDGANRLVIIKAASAVDSLPVDNSSYTANAAFGSGSQLGTGNYVVYSGGGSSVNVTGLTADTTYHVRIFEFNGSVGTENYKPDVASGNPASQLVFTTEYAAVLSRATTLGYTKPSAAQRIKQNAFVIVLKSSGAWTKTDVLWIFATDGDSDFATLNWKSPSLFQCTKVNSPAFSTNQGYTGNGTTSYLNTNWIPNTNGVNFIQDSACGFHYTNTNVGESGFEYGGRNGGSNRTQINTRNGSDIMSIGVNSALATTANTNSIGFYLNNRSGPLAADHDVFLNGALLDGSNSGSSTRTNVAMFICGGNSAGVLETPSTRQIGIVGFGGSLLTEQSALYTAWNNYFTSL